MEEVLKRYLFKKIDSRGLKWVLGSVFFLGLDDYNNLIILRKVKNSNIVIYKGKSFLYDMALAERIFYLLGITSYVDRIDL